MKCIVRECVFCQKKQDWTPIINCITCQHYKRLDIEDYEKVIVCSTRGKAIDGKFEEKK